MSLEANTKTSIQRNGEMTAYAEQILSQKHGGTRVLAHPLASLRERDGGPERPNLGFARPHVQFPPREQVRRHPAQPEDERHAERAQSTFGMRRSEPDGGNHTSRSGGGGGRWADADCFTFLCGTGPWRRARPKRRPATGESEQWRERRWGVRGSAWLGFGGSRRATRRGAVPVESKVTGQRGSWVLSDTREPVAVPTSPSHVARIWVRQQIRRVTSDQCLKNWRRLKNWLPRISSVFEKIG
jgi:hypothetical protein